MTATIRFEIVDVTEESTLRRERDEALAAVEEWRQLARRNETQATAWFSEAQAEKRVREMPANDLAKCAKELAAARAENERLRGELAAIAHVVDEARRERDAAELQRKLMHEDRNALIEDMGGARDRAIAERDEARKALAAQVEKTNECMRALNAYPGIAELATLRARVAELEAALKKTERDRNEFQDDRERVRRERQAWQVECIRVRGEYMELAKRLIMPNRPTPASNLHNP